MDAENLLNSSTPEPIAVVTEFIQSKDYLSFKTMLEKFYSNSKLELFEQDKNNAQTNMQANFLLDS